MEAHRPTGDTPFLVYSKSQSYFRPGFDGRAMQAPSIVYFPESPESNAFTAVVHPLLSVRAAIYVIPHSYPHIVMKSLLKTQLLLGLRPVVPVDDKYVSSISNASQDIQLSTSLAIRVWSLDVSPQLGVTTPHRVCQWRVSGFMSWNLSMPRHLPARGSEVLACGIDVIRESSKL
ncbi:hypothetical protein VKT23_002250 [Stygiomarasmius scandens]|uniref:Uncharacterized protein n=1 Tax=Marasmiellus scandens TaxID=2682957 RepID=A0ABR1K1G1_9AGAR